MNGATACLAPLAALLSLAAGCAHGWDSHADRPTCLVLSAGGAAGLAHLGALEAVKAKGLRLSCVTGTSMGALVGSLYAAAPDRPARDSYLRLLAQYEAQTSRDLGVNAMVGGLLGATVAGVMSGGTALPLVLGAGAGAAAALSNTHRIDLQRFGMVLDRFHDAARIEDLSVPFAAFHQARSASSLVLVAVARGPVASAVVRSIANPFIFEGFDPVAAGYVDPGADRLAAVPVEDTCKLFPQARLLAINASGQSVVHSEAMKCPLREVRVELGAVSPEALSGRHDDFDRVVRLGFEATQTALR